MLMNNINKPIPYKCLAFWINDLPSAVDMKTQMHKQLTIYETNCVIWVKTNSSENNKSKKDTKARLKVRGIDIFQHPSPPWHWLAQLEINHLHLLSIIYFLHFRSWVYPFTYLFSFLFWNQSEQIHLKTCKLWVFSSSRMLKCDRYTWAKWVHDVLLTASLLHDNSFAYYI